MSILSILVGVGFGLLTSFIYKHTTIRDTPKLESTLLFLFCYCCYAAAEAMELSGIMALFFNGIILSHYNSYNLSSESRHATEQVSALRALRLMYYEALPLLTSPGSLLSWIITTFLRFLKLLLLLRKLLFSFTLEWVSLLLT